MPRAKGLSWVSWVFFLLEKGNAKARDLALVSRGGEMRET